MLVWPSRADGDATTRKMIAEAWTKSRDDQMKRQMMGLSDKGTGKGAGKGAFWDDDFGGIDSGLGKLGSMKPGASVLGAAGAASKKLGGEFGGDDFDDL